MRRLLSLNRYLQRLCNRLKFRSSNQVIDIIVSALVLFHTSIYSGCVSSKKYIFKDSSFDIIYGQLKIFIYSNYMYMYEGYTEMSVVSGMYTQPVHSRESFLKLITRSTFQFTYIRSNLMAHRSLHSAE